MAVLTDPRYQRLASISAGQLGAGPNVQRAILAQFACEKAGEWPPQDNNPGNVHVGAMAAAGVRGLPGGVGDGGQVARFATPDAGAQGYATYIGNYRPAAGARAAIGRDDAAGYISAVTGFGYGTNASCWRSNYDRAAPVAAGDRRSTTPVTATPVVATPVVQPGSLPSTLDKYLGRPGSELLTLDLLRSFYQRAAAEVNEKPGDVWAFYVDFVGHRLDQIPAPAAQFNPELFGGAPRSKDPLTAAGDVVGDAIQGLGAAIGEGLRQAVLLLGILAVLGIGLYLTATARKSGVSA